MHFDLLSLVVSFGYIGITALIFAETGLFFGFFLPGDSVLFSVGLLASQGSFNIFLLVLLVCIAAVTGDSVGYWFGARVGPALFSREDSRLFKKRYVEETHAYYEKYGAMTLVLARFIPIVRTFAPILAGVGRMRYATFLRYNVLGGVGWAAGVTLLGYFLGNTIPGVDKYIYPIIAFIIVLSLLPVAHQWWQRHTSAPRP
jgi:membrane-associated protein